MRAVIQRVSRASVEISAEVVGVIGNDAGKDSPEGKSNGAKGLLILLGIEEADTRDDADWLVKKIAMMRIFSDEQGVMNRSLLDVGGGALVVSQFTLMASYKKGNRPSWFRAAGHDHAIPLYEYFVEQLSRTIGRPVPTGEFGADMQVSLVNDGPVTIIMDTKNKE